MATQASLLFRIAAENDADAALNELKGDLSQVDAEVKKLAKSSGLLPSEMRAVVKEFAALDKEADQVAFALKRFGAEGVEMVSTLQTLARQSEAARRQLAALEDEARKNGRSLRVVKDGADETRTGIKGLVSELTQLSPAASDRKSVV